MFIGKLNPRQIATLSTANDIFLSTLKWKVGHVQHSTALIADAKHSLSDVVVDIGAVCVIDKHPIIQRCYSSAVSIILFAVGVSLISESIKPRLLTHKSSIGVLSCVQAFVILSKELMFRIMKNAYKKYKSLALFSAALHQRSDVFTSLSATAGAALYTLGFSWADRLSAIFIALLIIKSSIEIYFQ